jgi:triosephosphate isomerase (TIM)
MRKPFVAGNWKMFKTVQEAIALVTEMLPGLEAQPSVERVVCPPFTALFAVSTLLSKSGIGLGAQNMHWEESGAFTGEISPQMVKDFCNYVIIGHSERRAIFGETDAGVNKKTRAALIAGLMPIVCVGETLEQNQAGQTAGVVIRQVREGLLEIPVEKAAQIIIAYEPVWAIGTGLPATGRGANEVVADMIRPTLKSMFGETISQEIRVLYGGSAKSSNVAEFFGQPDIDGALVGGASLKADEFVKIVQAAAR